MSDTREFTPAYLAAKRGAELHPGRIESLARARTVLPGAFFAMDLDIVEHPDSNIQGIDFNYVSSAKWRS
jgi:hypothetical protein